ncbi:hypothetical protein AB4K20DRAFT_1950207 [Rhizopus microsporus]
MNDVEEDYLYNIQRLMLNVGRMVPEERRRKTSLPGPVVQHEVTVLKSEMKSCTCNNLRYNNIACKHMYLLNRLHAGIAHFKENTVSLEQVDTVVQVDAINTAAETRVVTEHSSMSQDYLTAEMANLLAAYRSYREKPYRLTDEQIANIRLGTELWLSEVFVDKV